MSEPSDDDRSWFFGGSSGGDGIFTGDVKRVLALLAAIYAVYIAIGVGLGFELRGQLNSLATLTFYIGVFSLLALALNLHWGYTGLFNIGIVGFMAVGIYIMAVVSMPVEATGTRTGGLGLPLWVGMLAGTTAASLLGLVVAIPALRLRADYLAIVTIAMSEIVRFTFLSGTFQEFTLFGTQTGFGGGAGLLLGFDPVNDFLEAFGLMPAYMEVVGVFETVIPNNPKPIVDSLFYGLVLLVFVVGYYVTLRRLGNSPFGRVLKAIREDEDATKSLGKDTNAFKTKAFMFGCALMGLGGILWYMQAGAITPNTFRPRLTFFIWIALIIGGAGSNTGSVMGGAIFAAVLFQGPRYLQSVIEEVIEVDAPASFGRAAGPIFESADPFPFLFYVIDSVRQLQLVVMGLVLIWLMHNRPEGMLGHRKEEAAAIPLAERPGTSGGAAAAADGGTDHGGDGDE
jgi:branched-chain amino acid transport system permease protein